MKYKGQLKVSEKKKKVKIVRSWSGELFAAGAVKSILKWNIKSPVKGKILN